MNNKTLFIKNREIINIRLPYNNIRLYNALFIPYLNANLISSFRIIQDGFLIIYNHKHYIVSRKLNNQTVFKTKRLNNDKL